MFYFIPLFTRVYRHYKFWVRWGGMPLINFTNALKLEGLHNVNIDTSIEFANLSAAFIAGTGDGVNLFDDRSTIITFKKRFKL